MEFQETHPLDALNEAFNQHDARGMMAFMTEDCVFENTHPPPKWDSLRRMGNREEILGRILPVVITGTY
jgi:hypothetical protein